MTARPSFTKLFAELFRDYNTLGVPSTGVFYPVKSDVRAWGLSTEGFIGDLYDKAPTLLGGLGGTANAATATGTPTVDALAAGQSYWYTPAATNTAAAPTLNIDTLGAKVLADADGVDASIGTIIGSRSYLLNYDGTKLRVARTSDTTLYKVLDADDTGGTNVNTAQPWFPTTGTVTLPIGDWFVDAFLWLSRAAGNTSHTTSLVFAGGATYTIDWSALVNNTDAASAGAANSVAAAVATATVIKAASTSTTEQILVHLRGVIRVTVAGTFIPQFIYSVAPGGAPTVKRGSFIRLTPRPGVLASVGAWA